MSRPCTRRALLYKKLSSKEYSASYYRSRQNRIKKKGRLQQEQYRVSCYLQLSLRDIRGETGPDEEKVYKHNVNEVLYRKALLAINSLKKSIRMADKGAEEKLLKEEHDAAKEKKKKTQVEKRKAKAKARRVEVAAKKEELREEKAAEAEELAKTSIGQLTLLFRAITLEHSKLMDDSVKSAAPKCRKYLMDMARLSKVLRKECLAHQKSLPTKTRTKSAKPVATPTPPNSDTEDSEDSDVHV